MQAGTFAEGYQAELTPEEIHGAPHSALITEAQTWSYRWGLALHARLSGREVPTCNTEAEIEEYSKWCKQDFPALTERVRLARSEDEAKARNELNFHWLNLAMLTMWMPVLGGDPAYNRGRWLHIAQENLAITGFRLYCDREHFVTNRNSYILFEPENEENYAGFTGIAQEFDAGVELLNIPRLHPDPRRRNVVFVPAPLQFERSRSSRRNVDFVGFDYVEDRAIGVQVKTGVTEDDYANADQDRVVFVDGKVDFDNIRPVRTKRDQSRERVVPWPGIISARTVDGIKTHGARYSDRFRAAGVNIHHLKLAARALVGSFRVDHAAIAKRIGDRIFDKLYS